MNGLKMCNTVMGAVLCFALGCGTMRTSENETFFNAVKEAAGVLPGGMAYPDWNIPEHVSSSEFNRKILDGLQGETEFIIWAHSKDVKKMSRGKVPPHPVDGDMVLNGRVHNNVFVSPFDTPITNRAVVVLNIFGPLQTTIVSSDREGGFETHEIKLASGESAANEFHDFQIELVHLDDTGRLVIFGSSRYWTRHQFSLRFNEDERTFVMDGDSETEYFDCAERTNFYRSMVEDIDKEGHAYYAEDYGDSRQWKND